MKLKTVLSGLMLAGLASTVNADVCKQTPGSISCGKGVVKQLTGNGVVFVNGTTIEGATIVNGTLTADDANFASLTINGSVSLMQCTINETAEIKGSLKASSTKFERSLDIYSSSTRFVNSKINHNLQIHHTDNKKQEVYLDNNSEVGGDVIFDDGQGEVYLRGGSKILGKVIGGQLIEK